MLIRSSQSGQGLGLGASARRYAMRETVHLLLDTTQDRFAAAARHLAEQGIWTWPTAMTTIDPGIQRVELSVGDATCTLEPDRVSDIIATLTGR